MIINRNYYYYKKNIFNIFINSFKIWIFICQFEPFLILKWDSKQ